MTGYPKVFSSGDSAGGGSDSAVRADHISSRAPAGARNRNSARLSRSISRCDLGVLCVVLTSFWRGLRRKQTGCHDKRQGAHDKRQRGHEYDTDKYRNPLHKVSIT